jgi:hypothetical protein
MRMTGEARLWRSWNTMRSRYATATPALIPEYERGGAGAQPGRLLKFHAPEIVFGIDSMAEAAHAAVRLGALRALLVPDPHWTSTPPPTASPPFSTKPPPNITA